MLPTLCTCLLWLSTSGLWTVQAKGSGTDVSTRNPHRDLAPNNVDFAFTLYKHLVASGPGKNVFISPVSISTALAMLSLGARGYTREQLLQGLGFNLTEMSEAEIHRAFRHLHHLLRESNTTLEMTMGNALFLDHSVELLESFSADTKHYYELEALTTDFQDWAGASRQINEYIKNKTQGKIVDLFSESDSSAMLILVNYIFFKGMWAHSFDLESTREENFYVNETTTVKVPMMFQSNTVKYLNDSVLPCQLVQLDYTGNETVFFVLPVKGKMDSVITALSRDTIQRWSKSLTIRTSLGILSFRVQEFSWIEWNQLQERAEKKGPCNSEAQRRSCPCVGGRGRSCLLPCPLPSPQTAGPAGRQGHPRGNGSLAGQTQPRKV
ncbi:corticosteroid-binding globulin isoform X2 [Odocoileus virginianus]|uniref:Corticosteroid-binding globulin isoform X2 n=1 Tax=Odocoileus virginianus TaxID=9874 RepID=A0ABM4J1Q0_ODOVR